MDNKPVGYTGMNTRVAFHTDPCRLKPRRAQTVSLHLAKFLLMPGLIVALHSSASVFMIQFTIIHR